MHTPLPTRVATRHSRSLDGDPLHPPVTEPVAATTVVASAPAMHLSDLMRIRTVLWYGSELMINLQLPGPPNGQPYVAVRVLPPKPYRHVTHAPPFRCEGV